MNTENLIDCKNCGTRSSGNYCGRCGEQLGIQSRIEFRQLIAKLTSEILNLDLGFLYTTKALTKRPGHMVREYINGRRKPYFDPIRYYVLFFTLFFFLFYFLDYYTAVIQLATELEAWVAQQSQTSVASQMVLFNEVESFDSELFRAADIFLTLVLASTFYLFFRKYHFNFVETLILFFFLSGYLYLVKSVLLLMKMSLPLIGFVIVESLEDLIFGLYFCWGASQFYEQTRVMQIVRVVAIYILSVTVSGLLVLSMFAAYTATMV